MRAAFAALSLAAGCAAVGLPGDVKLIHGYAWRFDSTMPVCASLTWEHGSFEEMRSRCGNAACAVGCKVLSPYTEEQARSMMAYGESLYNHEARHVFGRMRHPPTYAAAK
jgi:hypothetical protein